MDQNGSSPLEGISYCLYALALHDYMCIAFSAYNTNPITNFGETNAITNVALVSQRVGWHSVDQQVAFAHHAAMAIPNAPLSQRNRSSSAFFRAQIQNLVLAQIGLIPPPT